MKYSIRESKSPPYENRLMRYDEDRGLPNNCEFEFWARIQDLEYCLAEIYHHTSCTTYQMELINKILPQE